MNKKLEIKNMIPENGQIMLEIDDGDLGFTDKKEYDFYNFWLNVYVANEEELNWGENGTIKATLLLTDEKNDYFNFKKNIYNLNLIGEEMLKISRTRSIGISDTTEYSVFEDEKKFISLINENHSRLKISIYRNKEKTEVIFVSYEF